MKYANIYEHNRSAGKLETLLIVISVLGVITSILVTLDRGWAFGFTIFIISVIAFALSRMFNLLGAMLGSIGRVEERLKLQPQEKDKTSS